MIKKILATALSVVTVLALTSVPAQASHAGHEWPWYRVCVEDRTGWWVPVTSARKWWNSATSDLRLIYKSGRGGCHKYGQKIIVKECWCGRTGWHAAAAVSHDSRRIYSPAVIYMNKSYGLHRMSWRARAGAIAHEMGHTIGLTHTKRWDSVMNTRLSRYRPTSYDLRHVRWLYR